jgi:beta-1,4-mannosyl-glycoprotein beta-1,4-N-acetylglucosaminyltransferase
MRKIIDCFTFFNELDILKFRLKELYNVVDHFIIVESNMTHSGNLKDLIFKQNEHLFSQYQDKIIYVVVEDMPHNGVKDEFRDCKNAWDRENFQRDCIMRGLKLLPLEETDIIIISDCDEIPDPDLLNQIKTKGFNIFENEENNQFLYSSNIHNKEIYDDDFFALKQDWYYYNIECKNNIPLFWYFSKILTYKKLKEIGGPQNARLYNVGNRFYSNGGWHFSYFGGVDRIIYKIESFAHQDLNLEQFKNKEIIKKQIENYKDFGWDCNEWIKIPVSDNKYLPKNYELLL